MRKSLYLCAAFLIIFSYCNTRRIAIKISDTDMKNIRAIIFLPVKSNFNIKSDKTYRMLMESAEYIASNSNYYVILPREYRVEKDCPFREIFICSDLKQILSEADIEPSKTLFIEYTIVEEKEISSGELSGRSLEGSERSLNSELKLKLISKFLHYARDEAIFEDRLSFQADMTSGDLLSPVYKYQKELLSGILQELNKDNDTNKDKNAYNSYFVNHFQAVYPFEGKEGDVCLVKRAEINKEIEAEMLFEEFYNGGCEEYIKIMKNYSCGILYNGFTLPFLKKDIFMKGDLIVSFCGEKVYGLYSIKNAYISKKCEKERRALVIRNSLKNEILF
ncbi:MAG: hypothetical protein N3B13_03600 [Deltaproteobacteria bacterium]|nr:hypothetical protein [Deltaproteobacteria bacterium]